jgi:hypothetical protein
VNEREKELMEDLLESPGWALLLDRVAMPEVDRHSTSVFVGVSTQDIAAANRSLGRYEGVVQFISAAYRKMGKPVPDSITKLRGTPNGRPDRPVREPTPTDATN